MRLIPHGTPLNPLRQASPYLQTAAGVLKERDVPAYHIAGGVFRDLLNGKAPKDVDVFIPSECDNVAPDYEIWGPETETRSGIEINLIKCPLDMTLENLLDRIDIGLCQIGVTSESPGQIFATDAFFRDCCSRTLTVTRETRVRHLKRVMEKFPDHRLIDPFEHDLEANG